MGQTRFEIRGPIANALRSWRVLSVVLVAILSIVSLGSLAYVCYPIIHHRLTVSTPTKIPFSSFVYYRLDDKFEELVAQAPFMEAVINSLTAEGEAQKTPYRIAVGTTLPFTHPTPGFHCRLVIEGGSYDVTGYAFRRHRGDHRTIFEPVPIEKPVARDKPEPTDPVFFDVPACEEGDELFVVALVTVREGTAFPENLQSIASLLVVP